MHDGVNMSEPTATEKHVEAGVIEVSRSADAFVDMLRAYKVLIDGVVVGELRPGDVGKFEVAPGVHELYLKIDWARSEKAEVELSSGELAKFSCAPRANLLTDLFWALAGWRRYIRLSRNAE